MIKKYPSLKTFHIAFFLASFSYQAYAENYVGVCPAEPVSRNTSIKLSATVDAKLNGSSSSLYHNYRLGIELPKSVIPDIQINQTLNVSLPVIHHSKDKAVITSFRGRKIELLLAGQVQQLEGQVLTIEIPLKKEGLFLVPPQSIYAPRGVDPHAFILKDNVADSVPVGVIQALENEMVLVSSNQLKNAKVICRGLNNLVVGEKVTVIAREGGEL